jgi:hypothetical protein
MPKTTFEAANGRKQMVLYYNDIRSINWFLNTPLEADDEGQAEIRTKSIGTHKRRRGPSDTVGTTIPTHTAQYLYDPSLKSGNALPGRTIRLQTTSNADVDEGRSFTLQGRAMDFRAYFKDQMKYETYVYYSEGGRHTLPPTLNFPEG